MITGIVTADREAVIRLEVHGPAGQIQGVDAVIDAGFDGWLSLPPSLIASLGLAWQSRGRALLADGSESIFDIYEVASRRRSGPVVPADGSESIFDIYEGIVIWDGQPRRVSIDESDLMPLVGMALLEGCELTIEVRPSGQVTVRALP